MAHIPLDRRSLAVLILFALFFTILSVIPAGVRADDNQKQIVTQITIDGDADAYQQWKDWSNYYNPSSKKIEHKESDQTTEDTTKLLLFNSDMYHGAQGGGWEYLNEEGTTFSISNVVSYIVGVTMFKNSIIRINNCKDVVLGVDFNNPMGGVDSGYLVNTEVVVSNFDILWIYNYTYTKSGGNPIQIIGNGHSTVYISPTGDHTKHFSIHPSVLSNTAGMIVRDVEELNVESWYNPVEIENHTPDLILENVKYFHFYDMPSVGRTTMIIDNWYYSVSDAKWERGGTGILTKNVEKVIGDRGTKPLIIKNCDVGIAFEGNGTGNGLNNSPYVKFVNCGKNYGYGESYTSLPAGLGDMVVGFQAITGVFVAIAWLRVAVYYTSEKREKKEMAKDMMSKAAIGSTIVAIVAYGYPIMVSMVNWIFGGG